MAVSRAAPRTAPSGRAALCNSERSVAGSRHHLRSLSAQEGRAFTRRDTLGDVGGLPEGEASWWPSRYGADDQIGSLNERTPECVLAAVRLVRTGEKLCLGRVIDANIPVFYGRYWRQTVDLSPHVTSHDPLRISSHGLPGSMPSMLAALSHTEILKTYRLIARRSSHARAGRQTSRYPDAIDTITHRSFPRVVSPAICERGAAYGQRGRLGTAAVRRGSRRLTGAVSDG